MATAINIKLDKSFESEQGSSSSRSTSSDPDSLSKFHNPHCFTTQNVTDFKAFSLEQKNSSQELYGFLGEQPKNSIANPLTTLTPISERTSIDENSCNAVDIPLAAQAIEQTSLIKKELSQFLGFNGHFQQTPTHLIDQVKISKKDNLNEEENGVNFLMNVSVNARKNTFVDQMTEDESDCGSKVILAAAKKVNFENLQPIMRSPSPDLFADSDEDDEVEVPKAPEEQPVELNESTEVESCNYIHKREKEVYKRMKHSLSGVPPPPSVVNTTSNLLEAIHSKKAEILESIEKLSNTSFDLERKEFLFKPSHSKEQVDQLQWKEISLVNYHGIHYNVSTISEKIESMTLQILERYVGCETASSYQPLPSSAKKRNERLKKLTQSPGSRLSHLAKRRSVFSSVNLQSKADTSLNSLVCLSHVRMAPKFQPG